MRFTLSVFATLAVAAGIVAAADASPSAAKDALDKAGVSLLFFAMSHMLMSTTVDTNGVGHQGL